MRSSMHANQFHTRVNTIDKKLLLVAVFVHVHLSVQLAVYKADFDQERQDRIQAHSKMAQMEKEGAKYKGQIELDDYEELKHDYQIVNNQLAEHQETLSVIEQINDTLRQEIQAKSSQVKQYAKEVDRLKRKVR